MPEFSPQPSINASKISRFGPSFFEVDHNESILTPYLGLRFHGVPAIVLIIDLLFLSPPWAITALPSLFVSGGFAIGYYHWVEHCWKHNNFYPYPVFEILDEYQRIGLFAFSAVIMSAATVSLSWMYARINGKPIMKLGSSAKPGDLKRE